MVRGWDNFRPKRNIQHIPSFRLPQIRWSYIKFRGLFILLLIALLLWLATGIYRVGLEERGVVLRFGRHVATKDPGLHWHLPYPLEQVYKPKVTEIKRVEVGFRTLETGGFGQAARYRDVPKESLMLTGDENIIDIDLSVQYWIIDPVKYLFYVRGVEKTVHDATEAALREVIGSRGIDEALTEGKVEIENDIKELLQKVLDNYEVGVQIGEVKLQDVHPPQEVRAAFRDVASAREDKNRLINEAQGYRNAILPKARGEAAKIIKEAEAYQEEKIRKAEGDAGRFITILTEYSKAKEITKKRLYLETMEEILKGMDKYIYEAQTASGLLPVLPLTKGLIGGKGDKKEKGTTP
jgi:membrane protease subunit HflK